MAKNDMHLIAYKILRYLYDCNKEGKTPTFTDLFRLIELPDIPIAYLGQIVLELLNNGYAEGLAAPQNKSGMTIEVRDYARITLKGVEYLRDNSVMKKAAAIAGKGFEILIESIIAM